MANNPSAPLWEKMLTWLLRLLCGGLFVFSGFVKAIDPWGTIFKIGDYLAVMGIQIPSPLISFGVFALFSVEFVVGCFLVLGCFRKSCPVVALLIMCFMLPFSLWIAIENPVSDCGCFGDALHISNWLTFAKNVILTAGLIWLLLRNLTCVALVSPDFQWLAVVASGIFVVIIGLVGYYYQPLIDFRDYPVDTVLFSQNQNSDEPEYRFIYEKDGERKGFLIDDLPDEGEGWKFIEREELPESPVKDGIPHPGFQVFDPETGDDVTDELSTSEGKELVVMIPEVSVVSPATTWKLNSLYQWSGENDVEMVGIVAGNIDEIENWKDLSMASYPIYMADDTAIKEVVRGNPGIVYLSDGKIIWKSSLSSIDVDDFLSPEVTGEASSFGRDNSGILRNISAIYLIFMAFLIFISFTPRLTQILLRGGLGSKKGVRHH